LVLLTGKLGAEYFLTRISIVIILTGLVHTFWGKHRLHTLAFPLLLLATMVPLPVIVFNALAQPLQLFASQASARVAQSIVRVMLADAPGAEGEAVNFAANLIPEMRRSLGAQGY
jgi:hypothetical protein